MKPNPGHCPAEAAGKRVRVIMRDGSTSKGDWAADGRSGCRWSLTGCRFDIKEYEVVS